MEVLFDFSTNAVPLIIREIAAAKEYVRIAMFQIHKEEVFNTLLGLLKQNVRVEILTLPYDSINAKIRSEVENKFRLLVESGAKIYFDKWNVGDPEGTRTAIGRWYSFHGKFIITEKSAIVLSANFTRSEELDAAIVFKDNKERVAEFNQQFERLIQLFVIPCGSSDGQIKRIILDVAKDEGEKLFAIPETVEEVHRDHWILHYPIEICPSITVPENKLYITPFDCRGRVLLNSIVENAKEWIYISTESFTDENFSKLLVDVSINKAITIKVLTGAKSRDFTDRLENMLRELLAQKIQVKIPVHQIHAKLLITDKALVVSSVNLNKMNLGHFKTRKYWRENTETIFVCQDPDIIETAKRTFEDNFNQSIEVQNFLCQKLEVIAKDVFKAFNLSPNPEVRALFARFILRKELETKKTMIRVGKITNKLMVHYGRDRIEKDDFISALILYHLSDGKRDYNQLKEKFEEVEEGICFNDALNKLFFANFIEKEEGYYKINVSALAY